MERVIESLRPSRRPLPAPWDLLRIAEKHQPGPAAGFTREHALLAFMTIGFLGKIGRQALAQNSGLGEGSMRSVLRKLRGAGYTGVDRSGCYLTESGRRMYLSISKKLTSLLPLYGSTLAVGDSQIAVLVRSSGRRVTSGIDQRDSAIRLGAASATTYVIRRGKFTVPGGSSDCEKDFPSGAWSTLKRELKPRDDDALVICGARDETTAKLGALSAALTLL